MFFGVVKNFLRLIVNFCSYNSYDMWTIYAVEYCAELERSNQIAVSLEENMRQAEQERRELEEARLKAEEAQRMAEEAAHLEKEERDRKVCTVHAAFVYHISAWTWDSLPSLVCGTTTLSLAEDLLIVVSSVLDYMFKQCKLPLCVICMTWLKMPFLFTHES